MLCLRNRPNRQSNAEIDPPLKLLSDFNQLGKGSKEYILFKHTKMEEKSELLYVLLNMPEVQLFLK